MPHLLDSLSLPSGLKTLSIEELKSVVEELRDELIDNVASVGGHFASSLGAAEITVALHHVFNTPHDKLVWDVGHQGYIHKMLTGRRAGMKLIRKKGGLSGFLKRSESDFDAFGAGHAGTSVSAALGMRIALDRKIGQDQQDKHQQDKEGSRDSELDAYTVAVIGDGSLTSGMVFEALNHAGALKVNKFIVLLNDNEMSISPNVGALSWLFSRAVTSRFSTRARNTVKDLHRRGYFPDIVYHAIDRAEEAAQGFLNGPAMLFESFGFRYIGPVDGHSLEDLINALQRAKEQEGPVVVHASTLKGKGYSFAEEDPLTWHAVTPFDRSNGSLRRGGSSSQSKLPPTYTSVFAATLCELAGADDRVIGITAAMAGGTGLDRLQQEVPSAFFDVGICEQHAVTLAAGLACEGFRPVCAIYSTFLQRAYDQVIHDVAIQNLPVVFAIDRAGVVGNDGETHQGVFDVSYLRTVPNMVVMSPADENELRHMLFTAISHDGPIALRYPRGTGVGVAINEPLRQLEIGKAEIVGSDLPLADSPHILLLCFGPTLQYGLRAAALLREQHHMTCTIVNARFAKPLDKKLLSQLIPEHTLTITVEDSALMGGFGAAVLELINEEQIEIRHHLMRFGVGDEFVPHGSQLEQQELNGYLPEQIVKRVAARMRSSVSYCVSQKVNLTQRDEVSAKTSGPHLDFAKTRIATR